MSRNATAKFIPTTNAIASECRVSELKNAIPDSRISMLSAVSSSLASVSSLFNPYSRGLIYYVAIMFR